MKQFLKSTASVLVILVTMSSCGVMFGGSKFLGTVTVPDHPNAKIVVNGVDTGKGKTTRLYKRNKPTVVEVSEEGCEKQTVTFPNTFRGGNFALSIIVWGVEGMVIDLCTGACYKPAHKNNPNVTRLDEKRFLFNVDYKGCPN